jgi:secreted trypsin-like serine protease
MRGLGSLRSHWPVGAVFLCALLTAGLTPAAAQASAPAQASIVGGKITSISDFPSLAFIEARDPDGSGFNCTGTVISPRVILTAAHCVEDLDAGGLTPPDEYGVVTGLADPHQAMGAEVLRVASTHVFPEFDPGLLRSDAGILILATPTAAPPIPLATSADAALYEGGASVQVAGWGLQHSQATTEPKRLRSASTQVQAPGFCKRETHPYDPDYSPGLQLCATDPPAHKISDCFGDSGGPVIAGRPDGSPVEIGIASVVAPGCDTKLPNIFTRADAVSTWALGWAAATELGAPSPDLSGPKAHLPRLSRPSALRLLVGTLTNFFGNSFTDSQASQGNCKSLGRTRSTCQVEWRFGPKLYFGTVNIYFVLQHNSAVVKNHFQIRRADLTCVIKHGGLRACPFQTARG